jgi:hypothetical protein
MHVSIQSLDYYNDARIVYKLVSYNINTEICDSNIKKAVDYLCEVEDKEMQQEVMQILA